MNHKRTGKGKGKHLEDINQHNKKNQAAAVVNPVPEEPVYPGALKRNSHIMAVMRNTADFKIAKIIEVRILKPQNEEEPQIIEERKAENLLDGNQDVVMKEE